MALLELAAAVGDASVSAYVGIAFVVVKALIGRSFTITPTGIIASAVGSAGPRRRDTRRPLCFTVNAALPTAIVHLDSLFVGLTLPHRHYLLSATSGRASDLASPRQCSS